MKISVYMPTKNRLEMLKKAVNSVLNQSYENLELIVVDDGSNDGTFEYLTFMEQRDNRLKVIRNEFSKGACVARNRAIQAASGDYVTGLDDDDEFARYHLESLVTGWKIIKKSHPETSCLYVQYVYRNGTETKYGVKKSSVTYEDLYRENHIGNQIFAEKDTYINAGLFNEAMPAWQDLEFFYRVLRTQGPARLVDVNTYIFDITPRSDRISSGKKENIIRAFELMVHSNKIFDKRIQQYLMIQIYSSYYGFKVELNDLFKFIKKGIWLKGWLFMLKRFFGINSRIKH